MINEVFPSRWIVINIILYKNLVLRKMFQRNFVDQLVYHRMSKTWKLNANETWRDVKLMKSISHKKGTANSFVENSMLFQIVFGLSSEDISSTRYIGNIKY